MAAAAEPRPAELPVAGGQQGATVRVHPLLCAEASWPDAWPHEVPGRLSRLRMLGIGVPREEWLKLPIVAFLVEHPTAGPFLIDTGIHPSVAEDPKQNLGRITAATGARTVEVDPARAVPEQVRARGVDLTRLRLVLMTHLHYDHASGMSQFPDATFLLTTHEWKAANGALPAVHGYVSGHWRGLAGLRTLDFDGPNAGSHSTFARSVDLFGDGSVRAVFTPGHTHGHMSVVLRTSAREILVAGDAVYTRRTLETGHLPAYAEDKHLFRRSLHEIQLYAQSNPGALVIPGHDWEAWHELDDVYE